MIDTPKPDDNTRSNSAPRAARPATIQVQQSHIDAVFTLNEDRGRLESEITEEFETAITRAETRRKEQTFEVQHTFGVDQRSTFTLGASLLTAPKPPIALGAGLLTSPKPPTAGLRVLTVRKSNVRITAQLSHTSRRKKPSS